MEEVKVQVRYTITENGANFTDALYYTLEQYDNLTNTKKEAEKQTRFTAWKQAIAVQPIKKTKEQQLIEIQSEKKQLQDRLIDIAIKETELAVEGGN